MIANAADCLYAHVTQRRDFFLSLSLSRRFVPEGEKIIGPYISQITHTYIAFFIYETTDSSRG